MQRLASGAALGGLALAAILFVPDLGLRVLACAVAVVAADEYLRLIVMRGWAHRAPWLVLVAACAWAAAASQPALLAGVAAAGIAGVILEASAGGVSPGRAALVGLAPWYVGAPLGLLAAVHAFSGPAATLLVVATVVVSDSGQFYTGRTLGRHRLAPTISPKKTVEGAAGGLALAAAFLALAGPAVGPAASPGRWAAVGLALAVLGIAGDLFESALKRAAGVKDSGALIPGHGGALDRIDALLFVIPAFYVYLRTLA